MKLKKLLIAITVIVILVVAAACNGTSEDVQEIDNATEEVVQTPVEEADVLETLPEPASDTEEVAEQPAEDTQPLESEDEVEDEPKEDEEMGDNQSQIIIIAPEIVEISADIDPELIGFWTSDENEFLYVFLADGTGVRSIYPATDRAALGDEFSWQVEDGNIQITFAHSVEEWGYAVMGDTVMFTSALLPGQLFIFNRSG